MENIAENPYKTPEAEVTVINGNNKLKAVYDRFPTWGVFALALITGGIYLVYWLDNRTKRINAHVKNPISTAFIATALILYVLTLLGGYILPLIIPNPAIALIIYPLIPFSFLIMQLVWYYKLRNRIHSYLNAQPGTYAWIGPVKTFFFTYLYIQYKINKITKNE